MKTTNISDVTKTETLPVGKVEKNIFSRIWDVVCRWFRFEILYYQDTWNNFNRFWEDHTDQMLICEDLKLQLSHLNTLD